uniref:UDP-glycosyltransferases domain-containing protein n=1 Tax=Fagus sylvatica TaxID=28930 RepID=A0A2N9F8F4_FAGSY
MNSMAEPKKLHIAMFPWLAFGHIIPFLELGKLIARKGHRVSFISTPRNIERLPKIPLDVAPLITLVKLPLPHVENLPENAEATIDVPYHKIPCLKKAHDGLQQPMSRFLETEAPDWVIHDFAPYWLPPITTKLGISTAYFSAEFMAIKTCTELEDEWVKLLGEIYSIPVIPVGLLPPSAQESVDNKDSNWDTIVELLNKQEKGSLVYIALGSEIQPSQEDFTELAFGLEQSGLPFFWALRKGSGSVAVELPAGFEERTKDRGIVWTGWAPQLKILAHESVGGFLTHCGWSSVTEAFQFGRALIMLPFLGDQGLIARFLEEKQAGIEVPRNEQDGSFTRDSVAETLRLVMKDEKGKIYRDKAKEMTTIFGDRDLQYRYIDKFVEFLERKNL